MQKTEGFDGRAVFTFGGRTATLDVKEDADHASREVLGAVARDVRTVLREALPCVLQVGFAVGDFFLRRFGPLQGFGERVNGFGFNIGLLNGHLDGLLLWEVLRHGEDLHAPVFQPVVIRTMGGRHARGW